MFFKLPVYGDRPCVLLTNDDGPPCPSSPNIFGFCKLLQQRLGWDVKVVIPDCQKSWVGKAYAISEIISVSYFYPLEPDGLKGETCSQPRPLKDGETMEWVLLSGTPATCANIALHNLYPGEIDMVISGPNHGRNCSTAFALSSGTLGAALAAALSLPIPGPSSTSSLHERHIPAIALSYGVVDRPVPEETIDLAHEVSVDLVKRLWDNWGYEDDQGTPVQVYSVNVPLVADKLRADKRKIYWTTMRRNSYGQLFKPTKLDPNLNWWRRKHPPSPTDRTDVARAGPGALPAAETNEASEPNTSQEQRQFHFAPSMAPLLSPTKDELPHGTDAWAFAEGYIGITPLKAEFSSLTDVPGGIASYAGKEWT